MVEAAWLVRVGVGEGEKENEGIDELGASDFRRIGVLAPGVAVVGCTVEDGELLGMPLLGEMVGEVDGVDMDGPNVSDNVGDTEGVFVIGACVGDDTLGDIVGAAEELFRTAVGAMEVGSIVGEGFGDSDGGFGGITVGGIVG